MNVLLTLSISFLLIAPNVFAKLDPSLQKGIFFPHAIDGNDIGVYIMKEKSISDNQFEQYLNSMSVYHSRIIYGLVYAKIPIHNIAAIDNSRYVRYIEQVQAPPKNDLSDVFTAVNYNPSLYDLTGKGVVAGQWEEKILNASHPDFSSANVTLVESTTPNNHATQVAGILIGNGQLSNGSNRGFAPNMTLLAYYIDILD